ncbi:ABC transporter permease [Desulfuromonas versatilis]|uniref:ABC transporter permease n=1 Tax=Desulfuromonas versatilis TaxID=2802975 RepID=A0ABM8HX69_9BACT|nr:FtsX-like permease family protein [Desulfuromonas versatilis]BCR06562.1 ABC transporter permease [Desulfuromonas versatilis]
MIRHLKILEFALASLLRRKFKNLSLILVYAFTVAVLASILFITHALRQEAGQLLAEAPQLVVQRLAAGRHDLVPVDYARRIGTIPGVGEVRPRYWGYYYDALTKANYTLLGVSGETPGLELLEGRMPSAPGECAVGVGVAEVRILAPGDDLIIIDSRNIGTLFEVTGVFRAESSLLTNDLVVLGEQDVIEFFGLPEGMATDIAVEVFNEREIDTVAVKIKKELPDSRPITRGEIVRTYDAVFNWRSGMMLTIFAAALAAFCILAWDKATGISAEEKREIGVLKAIGWDTSDILELKFWEGVAISVSALLLGLIGAYLHVFKLGATLLAPVLKGWSVLFPSFDLVPYVDLYQVFVLSFLTVAPYVASTVIPSWKAAVTDPETVMRS